MHKYTSVSVSTFIFISECMSMYVYPYLNVCLCIFIRICTTLYGVATVSRIDKIIRLFCRIASLLQGFFSKETCNFIDPNNCSQTIAQVLEMNMDTYISQDLHLYSYTYPDVCKCIFLRIFTINIVAQAGETNITIHMSRI